MKKGRKDKKEGRTRRRNGKERRKEGRKEGQGRKELRKEGKIDWLVRVKEKCKEINKTPKTSWR
jgi:hypothetical protein